jgi:Fe-S cluster assembly ATP-binding protein
MLLRVENLHASINNIEILNGINLEIKAGQIHVIMGLNGSGKSTLSKVLAGHPAYSKMRILLILNQKNEH